MQLSPRRYTWLIAALALVIGLLVLGGRPVAAQSDNPDLWYAEFWTNQELRGNPIMTRWHRNLDVRWLCGAPDGTAGVGHVALARAQSNARHD